MCLSRPPNMLGDELAKSSSAEKYVYFDNNCCAEVNVCVSPLVKQELKSPGNCPPLLWLDFRVELSSVQ